MRLQLSALILAVCCGAQEAKFPPPDPSCPKYPEAVRVQWAAARQREKVFSEYLRGRPSGARPLSISTPRLNFIDTLLFDKMAADGVAPAPLTTDSEFLRRVYLDLAGRIPQPDEVTAFLTNTAGDKRSALIDKLLASDGYVSQFTLYFNNRF